MSAKKQISLSASHYHASPSHSHEGVPLAYNWHDKHEHTVRELEEARARASQMEKTMRWWSDCTASWREKWSKVRSERNKAREEVRILRCRCDGLQRENGVLRKDKNEMETLLVQSGIPLKSRQSRMKNSSPFGKPITYQAFESPERDNGSNRKEKSPRKRDFVANPDSFYQDGFAEKNGLYKLNITENTGKETDLIDRNPPSINSLGYNCDGEDFNSNGQITEYTILDSVMEHDLGDLSLKENDVGNNEQMKQLYTETEVLNSDLGNKGRESSNSSSQPSPHRMSAMSDPLPEGCHASTRISAISDPLSELCGTSECSETGYTESIRSSEGPMGRRCRSGCTINASSNSRFEDSGITGEIDSSDPQLTMLKLRLEETTKTIQIEREEKILLSRENLRLQTEITELKTRLEDVRVSRQEAVKELVCQRAEHQKEVQSLQMEVMDEASSREYIDMRLADLRGELERLQEENAAEWGKRERLESEKLSLEREIKNLRTHISDLEERLEKRTNLPSDVEVTGLKDDIADKVKELTELRHSHSKLKKVLSEKSTELQHSSRRSDQYETEVKKLRSRVDELKKELAASEDELDAASNNIRKLQRTNDELQESVETLQVQVQHLQSRLRSAPSRSRTSNSPLQVNDSDQDTDGATMPP